MTPLDALDCADCQEDLSALLDGELTSGREALLREHLAGCPRCSARLAALRAVDAELAALPEPPVPGDLRGRLEARIAEGADAAVGARAPGRGAPPRRRRWLASRALGALAVAAAAVAVYLVVTGDEAVRSPSPAEAPQVARTSPAEAPQVARTSPAEAPQVARTSPEARPRVATTPAPGPAPVVAPAPQIAETPPPQPAPGSEPAALALDAQPVDDLAVALELDTVEDLDVIANLELLEALVALDEGTG